MRPDQDIFLENLFRDHFRELELYAKALLQGRDGAQAAVQDAFHVACEKIDVVMASPNPVGWMKLVVKNVVRNMNKQRNRELQLVVPLEQMELTLVSHSHAERDFELVESCKTLLSPEEFALIKGIVLDDIPYVEMAERQGITMWTCYKRVQRTLQKLERGLNKK